MEMMEAIDNYLKNGDELPASKLKRKLSENFNSFQMYQFLLLRGAVKRKVGSVQDRTIANLLER